LSRSTRSSGSRARTLCEIEPPELLKALRRVEARGRYYTVGRLRSTASRVFQFGIGAAYCTSDPTRDLKEALTKAPKGNPRPALTDPDDVGELMRRIEVYDAKNGGLVRYALAVKPYLGAVGLDPHAQPLAVGQRVFLVRRLGVADFGVAQLMHDGDVPRALCEPLSAWLRFGGCPIALRKRTTNVPGPSSVPAMYPERPDGHGGVRTAPGGNVGRNALFYFARVMELRRTRADG
jgi:hypothetical protein